MKNFKSGRFTVKLYSNGDISVLQHPTPKRKKDWLGRYEGILRMKNDDLIDLKRAINLYLKKW